MQNFIKIHLSCLILLIAVFSYSQEREFIKFTIADGLPQSQIKDVIQDENGFLWIATNGGGVTRYDGEEFKVYNTSINLISNNINTINYSNDLIYIGTKNGLSIISNNGILNFKCPSIYKINVKEDIVYLATSKGLKSLRDLKYVQSESQNSLIEIEEDFHSDKEKIDDLNNSHPKVVNIIGLNSINKVITDNQSNTWVASENGLYKIFKSNFDTYLKRSRITSLNSFNNKLLIGSSNDLTLLDSLGFSPILKSESISVVKNNSNQIFVGIPSKGIIVLDSLKPVDTLLNNKSITHLLLDKNKTWAVEKNKGIISFNYNFNTKSISKLSKFNKTDGIYDLKINDIKLDSTNRLWFATQQGFLGYIKDDVVRHLGKVLKFDVEINSLLIHENTIFLGSSGEGVRYSKIEEELIFNKLVGTEKLYSENISQLQFDANNNLWVGSHKGVDKVILSSDNEIIEVDHFSKNNGFEGIETIKNAITLDNSGNVWFGTIKGLSKYNDLDTERTLTKPRLFFDRIEVAYKSLDTIKLLDWTNSSNKLYLKPTDNHISFSFRTVDLIFADDIQYRWRLSTSEWSPWSTDRKVNYSTLSAGDYTFEAQSRIFNANQSEPISFLFNVDLPLIQKPWFRQLLLIIALLILFWFIRNYFKKLKIKNEQEKLALKTQNHLLSLEQKALQLQMNPHFIFNVLNGIKAMGAKDTIKMNDTVNKFAVLLRQTLSNSRKEHISLSEEIGTLKSYIEIEQSMSNHSFEYIINLGSDMDVEEILIPPMIIQPFVENAIRHGISSVENGEIAIIFSVNNEQLLCVIQDNGIGIEVSKRNKANTNHQSMALKVTKERIESLSLNNSFEIKELKDKNQVVLGTKVSFKLPLLTDY